MKMCELLNHNHLAVIHYTIKKKDEICFVCRKINQSKKQCKHCQIIKLHGDLITELINDFTKYKGETENE